MTTPINSIIQNENAKNKSVDEVSNPSMNPPQENHCDSLQLRASKLGIQVTSDEDSISTIITACPQQKKGGKPKFPKKATNILKAWLLENIDSPYPSDEVKEELSKATNLNRHQIQNWFTNTRKRYVQPVKKKTQEQLYRRSSALSPPPKNCKEFTSSTKSRELTYALEKKISELTESQTPFQTNNQANIGQNTIQNFNEEQYTVVNKPQSSLFYSPPLPTSFGCVDYSRNQNNGPINLQTASIPYGCIIINPVIMPAANNRSQLNFMTNYPHQQATQGTFYSSPMTQMTMLPNSGMPQAFIQNYNMPSMFMIQSQGVQQSTQRPEIFGQIAPSCYYTPQQNVGQYFQENRGSLNEHSISRGVASHPTQNFENPIIKKVKQ